MKHFLLLLVMCLSSASFFAQCEAGEVELQMNLYTDDWGNEVYWELLPSGQECGDNPIAFGGNSIDVGCDGAGQQDNQAGNGYASNAMIVLDPICLVEGDFYDVVFVDDWADWGLTFELFEDGSFAHTYAGPGSPDVWTFEAGNSGLPEYDSPCNAVPVEVDGDAVMFDNTDAVAQVGEVTPGAGNCGVNGVWCEGGVTNSVWGSFIAPDEGTYVITTCNEGTAPDSQVAVYSFDDCFDQSTYSLVTANDDGGCGVANYWSSTCYVTCAAPGTEFLIQMDGYYGQVGEIFLSVATWEGDASLNAVVSSIPCALNKGEDGAAFIMPWVTGWGVDYSSVWSGPNGYESTDNFIFNLNPGTYSLVATNPCGDEAFEQEWTILNPDPFSVSFDVIHPECPLSGNGMITPMIGGATAPYEVFWIGPDDFQSAEPALSGLGEGLFTTFITDDNGCAYEQNIIIEATNDFSFTIGIDTTICLSESYLLYGPADLTYTWQDGSDNQFFEVVGGLLGVGQFSFILNAFTDDGCEHTDALIVTVEDCTTSVDEEPYAQVNVFPIPSSGRISINGLPQITRGTLDLIDSKGALVYTEMLSAPNGTHTLDLDVATGFYTLRISDEQGAFATRVVID